MGVFPPVCKAMLADVFRLSFVSLCVSFLVVKVYSPCGLYVRNLTNTQTYEKTHFRTWACKRGLALRGEKLTQRPPKGVMYC